MAAEKLAVLAAVAELAVELGEYAELGIAVSYAVKFLVLVLYFLFAFEVHSVE